MGFIGNLVGAVKAKFKKMVPKIKTVSKNYVVKSWGSKEGYSGKFKEKKAGWGKFKGKSLKDVRDEEFAEEILAQTKPEIDRLVDSADGKVTREEAYELAKQTAKDFFIDYKRSIPD